MKITRIEPLLIAVPYEHGGPKPTRQGTLWSAMNTLLVRVDTDTDIVGWGEGFGFAACPATAAALSRVVAPQAIGRDPRDITALMDDLYRQLHNFGRNGPVGFALSALDIALWDIAGKVAGKPLYALLGGKDRTRVPAYASLLRYGDPDLVARNASAAVASGYSEIKLHETRVEEVAAAREAIGRNVALTVDTNCPWTPEQAIDMARRFAPYKLKWLEEPVWPPDDCDGLARVSASDHVPIAAGENAATLNDFSNLARFGGVSYVQPSVTKAGGVSGLLQVRARIAGLEAMLAPHSPYFGPGLLATVHFIAAMPEPMKFERFYCELEASPFGDAVDARDGMMRVPQAPGLGIEPDHTVIERYRVAL